jgi:hypothetical protein
MDSIGTVIAQYALQAPLWLVWIGGMFVALGRWQRHPRISLLACILCGALLVESIIGTFIYAWLPQFIFERGQDATTLGTVFAFIGAIRSLIHAVLWGLALFAIFAGRADQALPSTVRT